MITFRFYLVTLVAVFLAVALGVVIGSTFTEPALVENLQGRIDDVQDNLDDRVAAIDELNDEVDALTTYLDESAPWAVDSQLVGTEVVVVADEGVDSGSVEALVMRSRQGGATTRGIVWVKPSFALEEDEDALALEEALGPFPAGSPADNAWEELIGTLQTTDVSAPGSVPTTVVGGQRTTTIPVPAPSAGDALLESGAMEALEEAEFIEIQTIDGPDSGDAPPNPDLPVVVVLVTGQASEMPDPAASVAARAGRQAALGIPTVVAEVFAPSDDEENRSVRGETLSVVIESPELAEAAVSTVDDLDLVQGRVAAVLAASDLGRSLAGNYGYGDGAERVLPEWLGTDQ